MSWVVMKFGGTSVASRERWDTIAQVSAERLAAGLKPLVVCSALSGVSDALEGLMKLAVAGEAEPALAAIEQRHRQHALDLEVDPGLIDEELERLRRLVTGVHLLGEASPRVHAQVLAAGELLCTRLGAAFLARELSVGATWMDAREALVARPGSGDPWRTYQSATCTDDADPALAARWAAVPGVLVTQGFIASNRAGETVLLGRGGSDTSAALLAARLQARRCEIWTDVPGLFTANPRQVPQARLLRRLDYDEAQEIATMGAKVLHPRSIPPCRTHGIPMHVLCTPRPELEGTVITSEATGGSKVKAVSSRAGLALVSMDTVKMWQQVGFLADAFAVFKAHGLSVDLVSTSEFNVTCTLDPAANALGPAVMAEVVNDLSPRCEARVIAPVASVSLVGRNIRGILHQLGPALAVFKEQRVHLVSQAAGDLNLSFVVDEEQAARLVRELHAQLFASGDDPLFGPTWDEIFGPKKPAGPAAAVVPWWQTRRPELLALARSRSPLYVLDADTLQAQADALLALRGIDRVLFAMKANPHPEALRLFEASGIGFECVSPGELDHLFTVLPDLDPARVLYTPNFAPRADYVAGLARGVNLTLDNLHPLQHWPEVFAGRELFVRLDPGRGRGHHPHVRTAGAQSKFGIAPEELDTLSSLARQHGVRIVGLHAHAGSGVGTPEAWAETGLFLASVAERFPEVRVLDLGGGLGVPDSPGDPALDLGAVDEKLIEFRRAHPGRQVWIEPGRFLVAQAGVLLATVTQLKRKGDVHYVGLDTGMNSLIRPALYGAFHPIRNLTRLDAPPAHDAHVVGPICETGDTLGYNRPLPLTSEGDVLLVGTTGAYGRAMSSRYNLREPADEVLLPPTR